MAEEPSESELDLDITSPVPDREGQVGPSQSQRTAAAVSTTSQAPKSDANVTDQTNCQVQDALDAGRLALFTMNKAERCGGPSPEAGLAETLRTVQNMSKIANDLCCNKNIIFGECEKSAMTSLGEELLGMGKLLMEKVTNSEAEKPPQCFEPEAQKSEEQEPVPERLDQGTETGKRKGSSNKGILNTNCSNSNSNRASLAEQNQKLARLLSSLCSMLGASGAIRTSGNNSSFCSGSSENRGVQCCPTDPYGQGQAIKDLSSELDSLGKRVDEIDELAHLTVEDMRELCGRVKTAEESVAALSKVLHQLQCTAQAQMHFGIFHPSILSPQKQGDEAQGQEVKEKVTRRSFC